MGHGRAEDWVGRASVPPGPLAAPYLAGLLGSWEAGQQRLGSKLSQELRSALHRLPRPNPASGSDLPRRGLPPPSPCTSPGLLPVAPGRTASLPAPSHSWAFSQDSFLLLRS